MAAARQGKHPARALSGRTLLAAALAAWLMVAGAQLAHGAQATHGAQPAHGVQPASGAQPASAAQPAEPGSELTIYLVTMGPGDAVWERFGHNALWVRDAATGLNVAYNYGVFDFQAPGYLRNFIRGRLDYWVEAVDAEAMLRAYAAANRSIWVQELNLTPAERLELWRFLQWNARPENRTYRYDYYRDNCSTRVRDAIDRVLGGRLRQVLEAQASGMTYRAHTRRLVADDLPVYYGLDLAMSEVIDVPLSLWAESFLPMELMENVRRVTVTDAAGREVPLVKSETLLFEASRDPSPEGVPTRLALSALLGVLLGGALALAGRAARQRRWASGVFVALALAWSALAGVLGALLAFLWAGTDHWVTYGNENLLQTSPLSLALLVLLPLAVRGGARSVAALRWSALALALLSVSGFLLQALPGLDQVNGEIIALALPAHLGLAAGAWSWLARPAGVMRRLERRAHTAAV